MTPGIVGLRVVRVRPHIHGPGRALLLVTLLLCLLSLIHLW